MDRSRRRSGLLIVLAALAGGFATNPPLRALRWLAPGADGARILTHRPVECLTIPADVSAAYEVEIGRAAFRSPLVLGGQAARAGIDCETCHRGGRTNRDFDFPGLSGAPGTADVTTSLFSSHRGDGIDNPKPIPDLGGPRAVLKVSQIPAKGDLERFIHGIVTQEFDGAEPTPAVLTGLSAYVRAMSPAACPPGETEALRVSGEIADARRAVRAGLAALGRKDPATAVVMAEAARSALGAMAERYAPPALAGDARALQVADLDLAAAISDIRRGDPTARATLEAWLARSNGWAVALTADERRSYYDRASLAAAIGSP